MVANAFRRARAGCGQASLSVFHGSARVDHPARRTVASARLASGTCLNLE
jgi:hypothetical protein